jgi:hypothetical protein
MFDLIAANSKSAFVELHQFVFDLKTANSKSAFVELHHFAPPCWSL